MNMIIENNSSFLSDHELNSLLNLLDEDHLASVRKIVLFRNKMEVVKFFKSNFKIISYVLRSKFMGFESDGNIFLFPFLLDRFKVEKDDEKFLLVHILFHEVRHSYQRNNLTAKLSDDFRLESKNYSEQWEEKDANDFAYQIINENRPQILKICGITKSLLFKNTENIHA